MRSIILEVGIRFDLIENTLQLSHELTETVFLRSINSSEDRSSTSKSNSSVNRHRRRLGRKRKR